jgi:Putative  PD-(D/E)XK family member, (DUF4420)
MMTASDALRQTWAATSAEAAARTGYYHRRVSFPGHVVYAGIVRPGVLRRLSIEVEKSHLARLNFEDQTRGYVVTVEDRDHEHTGRTFIHLQEVGASLSRDLFVILCADVLDHISKCSNEPEAIRVLHDRLQRWKRFFQSRSPEGLSREEYIGLYAELDFFAAALSAGISPEALANGWQGPIGANQDFLFGGVAVEIKACTGNDTDFVSISNVRQLDDTGLDQLFLYQGVYDFRQDAGQTLKMLIERLRELLAPSASAADIFEERLLAAGYIEPSSSPFERYGFSRRSRRAFHIEAGFPRLLESSLPHGVSDVRYTLNLAACAAFGVTEAIVNGAIVGS